MMDKNEKDRMNEVRRNKMQALVDSVNGIRKSSDKFSYSGLGALIREVKTFAKKEGYWLGRKMNDRGFVELTVEDFDPALQPGFDPVDVPEDETDDDGCYDD